MAIKYIQFPNIEDIKNTQEVIMCDVLKYLKYQLKKQFSNIHGEACIHLNYSFIQ